jgi:hypothetical protein
LRAGLKSRGKEEAGKRQEKRQGRKRRTAGKTSDLTAASKDNLKSSIYSACNLEKRRLCVITFLKG